jgi:hypothetical protein
MKEDDFFYSSVIGDVKKIWKSIDECTLAAREASTYPFHLSRPSILTQYDTEWSSK